MSLEFTTKVFRWLIDDKCGKDQAWLSFVADDKKAVQEFILGLTDKAYDVTIKQHREKRSLDANAYYHVLKDEIAEVLRTSKEELHVELLRRYGQTKTDVDGNKMIVSVESKIDFGSFYKYYDVIGTGVVSGKDFTHYKILKGSSELDSREMAILIDGVVSEAQELGIETKTPQQIAELKRLWEERQ